MKSEEGNYIRVWCSYKTHDNGIGFQWIRDKEYDYVDKNHSKDTVYKRVTEGDI